MASYYLVNIVIVVNALIIVLIVIILNLLRLVKYTSRKFYLLSTMVNLRGFELNQIKAKVALKVLNIEQLGLPSRIRTTTSIDNSSECSVRMVK